MHNTTMTGYDQSLKYYATRYKQGGRTVFSLDLSLTQVATLLPAPDPAVVQPGNRRINLPHAAAFAQYVRSRKDWVVPGVMLRSHNIFDFETLETIEGTDWGVMSFPRNAMADLHILDGQHRILGIHMAIQGAASDLDKLRTSLAMARKQDAPDAAITSIRDQIKEVEDQRTRFDRERLPVQVHVVDEVDEFQQMFYDIAANAMGVKVSEGVRFDKTRVVNRVMQAVLFHPILMDRVDVDKDRLGSGNPNILAAKHVVEIVRILAVGDGRITHRVEAELSEDDMVRRTNDFLDLLAAAFPQLSQAAEGTISATELRQVSQLGSPVTLRVLAGLYHDMKEQGRTDEKIARTFKRLNGWLSKPATPEWVELIDGGLISEGDVAPSSRRQDLKAYKNRLVLLSEGRKLPAAKEA